MTSSNKYKKHKYKVTRISTKNTKNEKISKGIAIIGFFLNILVLPGLGSIIGEKTKIGIWQIILLFIGGIGIWFNYTFFGILLIAVWIWGFITGIQMLRNTK